MSTYLEGSSGNKGILAIALPMMASSASVPILGLVDTALLGHLESEQFLGAVALGSMFIGLMYWSFGFLRMGTTGLSAQALGQHRMGAAPPTSSPSAVLSRAVTIGAVLGFLVLLAIPPVLPVILEWLQASEAIRPLAQEYIDIRRYSAPATFVTMAVSGYLVGIQRAKAALALVLLTNLSNIALDIWFINGLGWASAGAARATLIAEYLGLVLALVLAARYSDIFRPGAWAASLSSEGLWSMITVNYHLLIRTLLLLLIFNFFTAQGSAQSETILAANAILLQLVFFSAYVLDGFSYAAEALCGEAYGAKNFAGVRRIVKACRNWMLATSAAFIALFLMLKLPLILLMSDIAPVIEACVAYYPWVVATTAVGFTAYLMDGIFIGVGNTRAMHYTMWLSCLIFLAIWYATSALGNHGLWLAYFAFVTARGLSLLAVLKRQPWFLREQDC